MADEKPRPQYYGSDALMEAPFRPPSWTLIRVGQWILCNFTMAFTVIVAVSKYAHVDNQWGEKRPDLLGQQYRLLDAPFGWAVGIMVTCIPLVYATILAIFVARCANFYLNAKWSFVVDCWFCSILISAIVFAIVVQDGIRKLDDGQEYALLDSFPRKAVFICMGFYSILLLLSIWAGTISYKAFKPAYDLSKMMVTLPPPPQYHQKEEGGIVTFPYAGPPPVRDPTPAPSTSTPSISDTSTENTVDKRISPPSRLNSFVPASTIVAKNPWNDSAESIGQITYHSPTADKSEAKSL